MDSSHHLDPPPAISLDPDRLSGVALALRRRARDLRPPDPDGAPDTAGTTPETAHMLAIVEKRVARLARRLDRLADDLLATCDDHLRTEARVVELLAGARRRVDAS